jgi:thiol-disulfide isomerase/thioredoxin
MNAQSFYVLTGVKNYDPIVVNMTTSVDIKYNAEIKELMQTMSKELNIDTKGHPSRVLAFIITNFSVGDTVALKLDLELGEYMQRSDTKEKIFALTYVDTRMFKPEELEEDLIDNIEEMLEKFALQYKDDNKKISTSKKVVSHKDFSADMMYETDYKTALLKAKKAGKPLMIFMTTNYCPWCRKLENRVLSKSDIDQKIKQKYIPLMLNLDEKKFPAQFQEIVFNNNGKFAV